MSSLKNGLVIMSALLLFFSIIGCEDDRNCGNTTVSNSGNTTVNATSTTSNGFSDSTTPTTDGWTTTTTVPSTQYTVTVYNNSSYSVAVNGRIIASGGHESWNYTGSTSLTYDTLAGYYATEPVSGGNCSFYIQNCAAAPGTVVMSGGS